jgi:hypothetical protein
MRKTNEQSLKEAIQGMLNAYRLQGKLDEVRLIGSWEKVMGRAVSARTKELFVREGKLHVRLTSASLREELLFSRGKIVERLNEEAGVNVITDLILL